MEVKKSVKADLEWRKPMFIEIGLLAALAIVLLAFEFIGTRDKEEVFDFGPMAIIEEEQILQTEQQKETPPPPPQQNTTVLDIVSNELHVEDFSIDAEADEETVVEEVEYQIEDPKKKKLILGLSILILIRNTHPNNYHLEYHTVYLHHILRERH